MALYSTNFDEFNDSAALGGQGNWLQLANYFWVYDIGGGNNIVFSDSGAPRLIYYNVTTPNDHYAEIELIQGGTPAQYYYGPACRISGSTMANAYCYAYYASWVAKKLVCYVNGTEYVIATSASGAADGDVLKIVVEGSTITCYRNGSVDTTLGAASSPATGNNGIYTDTRVTSGKTGMYGYGGSGATNIACTEFTTEWSTNVELTVADTLHDHTVDSVNLEEHQTVSVNESLHDQLVDNIDLIQIHSLIVQESNHGHSVDNIVLLTAGSLQVQESLHTHIVDNITVTQVHILSANDSTHGHTADNVVLIQKHTLVVADTTHAHAVDNVVLTQSHILSVDDSVHVHTAEGDIILVESGGIILVIQDTSHGLSSDNIDLTQKHLLTINDTSHTHLADGLIILILATIISETTERSTRTSDPKVYWSEIADKGMGFIGTETNQHSSSRSNSHSNPGYHPGKRSGQGGIRKIRGDL